MDWLKKFMSGRYGVDELSTTVIILGFLITPVSSYLRIPSIIPIIIFVYAYYRVLSKDKDKRSAENKKFLKILEPITSRFKKSKMKMDGSKNYKYFTCKNCKQEMKVPKGNGKIRVTCPKCGEETIQKS